MRHRHAFRFGVVLGALLLATAAAVPARAAAEGRSFVQGYAERDLGRDGHEVHVTGTIVWDTYFFIPGSGWQWVGTDTNPSVDLANGVTGNEVFRGTFNFRSATIGDFSGSFVWHEAGARAWGSSVGMATDGSGRLWKADLASVDPAPYEPLPDCVAPGETTMLGAAQIIAP
jgi:hypothetical protein